MPAHCGDQVPREWADGFARLSVMPCPPSFLPRRWQLLMHDARCFMADWALRCADLGWTTEEVFGVLPQAPDARHDGKGLVVLIGGYEVTDVDGTKATVRNPSSGNLLSIYRRKSQGQIPIWELKDDPAEERSLNGESPDDFGKTGDA